MRSTGNIRVAELCASGPSCVYFTDAVVDSTMLRLIIDYMRQPQGWHHLLSGT
jgi:hypothetical protein